MKRPRLDLGLEASRATLNEGECVRLGEVLGGARRARGLSVKDVGAKLLLAAAQVSALESVRADAFYSAEFYATALKKYAALMGLDAAETDHVLVRPIASSSSPAFKRGRGSVGASLASVPRPSRRVLLGAGIVVTAVAGGLLVAAVLERSSARHASAASGNAALPPSPEPVAPDTQPQPALQPLEASPPTPFDETAPPAMVPVSTAAPKSVGHLRVGQRTWVFVRFATGATLERTLGSGEELILKEVPTYIAVGTADDTSIEIAGQSIDTSLFTVNGQLRVGASQLARLVAMR
ncbi:MAG: helix-turn-helix domain-containing protein [Acidobacteriota bacterium]